MYLTFKYRIKDSTSRKKLTKLASSVNYVWNYINDLSFRNIKNGKFLSAYNIDKYLAGAASELGLNSTSLQELSKAYVSNRKTFKKNKLVWRSAKRNTLGWIPFKASAIHIADDVATYKKISFRFYKSREIPKDAKIKSGSFNQDNRGRWYLNLVIDVPSMTQHTNSSEVGIDIGLKNKISLSNGETFSRENVSKQYEDKLASAQRANKKKQVKTISAKIKNIRKDWTHKITTQIAKKFALIVVGDLSSNDIVGVSNNINKSIYDTAIYQIKSFLTYKAIKLGGECKLVNEAFTTQDCSACGARTGPCGKEDLHIREWACACGASHNRDTNSAINILRLGH